MFSLKRLRYFFKNKEACRNTRIEVLCEKREGFDPQVVILMTDKCTGFRYVAAYNAATAFELADEIRKQAKMVASGRIPRPDEIVRKD